MKFILFIIIIVCAILLILLAFGFGMGIGATIAQDILTGKVDMNRIDKYGFSELLKRFYVIIYNSMDK